MNMEKGKSTTPKELRLLRHQSCRLNHSRQQNTITSEVHRVIITAKLSEHAITASQRAAGEQRRTQLGAVNCWERRGKQTMPELKEVGQSSK